MMLTQVKRLLMLMAAVAACDKDSVQDVAPPVVTFSHGTAGYQAGAALRSIGARTQAALDGVSGTDVWTKIGDALEMLDEAFGGGRSGDEPGADGERADGDDGPPPPGPPPGPEDPADDADETDIAEVASEIADFLDERVFTAEALESTDGASGTYRVDPDAVCSGPDGDGEGAEEPDEECVNQVEYLQLRVRATLVGEDGVDLAILVGPDRLNPITFEIRTNEVAAVVDLGAARATLAYIADYPEAEDDDEFIEFVEMVTELRGKVRISLAAPAAAEVRATLAVLEAAHATFTRDGDAASVDIAATNPTLQATVIGTSGAASLAVVLNIAGIDVSVPWAWLDDDSESADLLEAHLDGATLSASMSEGDSTIQFTGVGLGGETSYVKVGGTQVFGVDVNKAHGRSFDLAVTPTDASVDLTFSPAVTLELAFYLDALAAELDSKLDPDEEGVPEFLYDETYSASLIPAAAGGNATVTPRGSDDAFEGGLEVQGATLTLDSTKATVDPSIVATDGQCLTGDEDGRAEELHELLRKLTVVACP
jgi:hypothetical protein